MSLSSETTATMVSQAQHTRARSQVPFARRGKRITITYLLPSKSQSMMQTTDNFSVLPVIPGMFIPPHPTPAAPSPFAIVRWWFSQDHESHRLECSIAGFATQIEQNRQRLRVLEQESEGLKLELSQALEKKRRVRHRPTLPNYEQMYRNFDAALETMRNLRRDVPLHQCTHVCSCPQEAAPSYPEWLVPRKRLRWYAPPPPAHSCQDGTANIPFSLQVGVGHAGPGPDASPGDVSARSRGLVCVCACLGSEPTSSSSSHRRPRSPSLDADSFSAASLRVITSCCPCGARHTSGPGPWEPLPG